MKILFTQHFAIFSRFVITL